MFWVEHSQMSHTYMHFYSQVKTLVQTPHKCNCVGLYEGQLSLAVNIPFSLASVSSQTLIKAVRSCSSHLSCQLFVYLSPVLSAVLCRSFGSIGVASGWRKLVKIVLSRCQSMIRERWPKSKIRKRNPLKALFNNVSNLTNPRCTALRVFIVCDMV